MYMILQLYWESGTKTLVLMEASTVSVFEALTEQAARALAEVESNNARNTVTGAQLHTLRVPPKLREGETRSACKLEKHSKTTSEASYLGSKYAGAAYIGVLLL